MVASCLICQCVYWLARVASAALSPTYMTLGAPERGYWAASCVSTIHAVLLSAFCYHAATSGQIWDKWDFFLATPESTFCICVFCGYLCCDLCIALYYREAWAGWKMNIAHHIVVILSLVQMLSGVGSGHATYGHCFAMSAGMTELTTPFVNNRWFMDQMGMKSSPVFVVNGLLSGTRAALTLAALALNPVKTTRPSLLFLSR